MLKATDLRERSVEDLRELEKTLAKDVFQNRFKNFTNRLDDTSSIRKAKKDLARVKTILHARSGTASTGEAAEAKSPAPKAAPAASKPAAPKKEKAAAAAAVAVSNTSASAATEAKPAVASEEKPAKKAAAKKTPSKKTAKGAE
jgi:large subunit ribosomal protein L29